LARKLARDFLAVVQDVHSRHHKIHQENPAAGSETHKSNQKEFEPGDHVLCETYPRPGKLALEWGRVRFSIDSKDRGAANVFTSASRLSMAPLIRVHISRLHPLHRWQLVSPEQLWAEAVPTGENIA
jgi:hypothetical protein